MSEGSNMDLWSILSRTDPSATKSFTRGGGFKGTAIKPMWSVKRLTEEFGPCGDGWGVEEPSFQVVPASDGQVAVYCTVCCWYNHPKKQSGPHRLYGVGGDLVVVKQQSGLRTDDEAFKKAFTDAVTNAFKYIGVGADVHMGLFDDSKYVSEMMAEFSEEKQEPSPPKHKQKTVAERKAIWAQLMDELKAEAPKGWRKMVAYMENADTKTAIEELGDYKKQFLDEARELTKLAKAGEEASGEPVAKAMSRVLPSFDHLDTSPTPDAIEELLERQGDYE